jgi:23S rRNA (uracil1939-C5)-methyltransferase
VSQKPEESARPRPVGRTYRVDSLAFGGEGVARDNGKVCFIAGALPGELVEAVPASRRRQYDRLRLTRLLERSEERRGPLCPHQGVCGGCVTQSLRYEAQLEAKAAQVRDCLERVGKISIPEFGPPLPSPLLVGYRNKMELSFSSRPWLPDGPPEGPQPTPALGLHVAGRFDGVFDLEECALTSGASLTAVRLVREFARERGLTAWRTDDDEGLLRHLILREGKNTGEVLVALVVRREHPSFPELAARLAREITTLVGFVVIINRHLATIARGDTEHVLFGRPYLQERLCGLTFTVQAQSFFQTNTYGAEVLIGAMHRMLRGRSGGRLLDLYCGAGTLGLSLARRFERVTGVEQVTSAVNDARENALRNGLDNTNFVRADAEDWLSPRGGGPDTLSPLEYGPFSGVLVDPPRAGLHPRALRGLLELAPPWIFYVSCNPATLARDAAQLVEEGYRPLGLQVVDMFPHTAHIECLGLFDRSSGA